MEPTDLSTSQLEADDGDLRTGLRGLSGMVAGARGVLELLAEVSGFAAEAIPGVDGAGVAWRRVDPPSVDRSAATAAGRTSVVGSRGWACIPRCRCR